MNVIFTGNSDEMLTEKSIQINQRPEIQFGVDVAGKSDL
jgi:hypothetical protein